MIEKYEVITYDPILDYGGWGIKYNRHGKAYNVSGNKGLQLYLKNGKRILIGTQKESELTNFLTLINKLKPFFSEELTPLNVRKTSKEIKTYPVDI
jgi:hypothetical protein